MNQSRKVSACPETTPIESPKRGIIKSLLGRIGINTARQLNEAEQTRQQYTVEEVLKLEAEWVPKRIEDDIAQRRANGEYVTAWYSGTSGPDLDETLTATGARKQDIEAIACVQALRMGAEPHRHDLIVDPESVIPTHIN